MRAPGCGTRLHIFHLESFVVPDEAATVSVPMLDQARAAVRALNLRMQDVVLVSVPAIPDDVRSPAE
jgi:hypothetical protein